MFLKDKSGKKLNQLTHQQKVRYLQRVTKVSLNNLKTNIIQSDLESENQDIHYPLSMHNYTNNKQSNQNSHKIISQKKEKHLSLQQKLNKTIRNMTQQLYVKQTERHKQQNMKLFANKQEYRCNSGYDQQCNSVFNLHLRKNQDRRIYKLVNKSNTKQQKSVTDGIQKQINRQSLFNITFIPISKMTNRISQPLKQVAIRSNIFMAQNDFNEYSTNQNMKQTLCQQTNAYQKKQKFNRSNRKSYNQVNKENLTDKKKYSLNKQQDKNLSGWITKRQGKHSYENQCQKQQVKQNISRKPLKQINLQVKENLINIRSKSNLKDDNNVQKQKQQDLNFMKKKIKNNCLYYQLKQCKDAQKVKQFCQLLLNWYKTSEKIQIKQNLYQNQKQIN